MLTEWMITVIHAGLCVVMVVGVVFARTRIALGAVLATLLLLFFGIRIFRGCVMDNWERCGEKPTLADLGIALTIEDPAVDTYVFEQAVVGNLLLVQIIKIFVQSILPVERFFE